MPLDSFTYYWLIAFETLVSNLIIYIIFILLAILLIHYFEDCVLKTRCIIKKIININRINYVNLPQLRLNYKNHFHILRQKKNPLIISINILQTPLRCEF